MKNVHKSKTYDFSIGSNNYQVQVFKHSGRKHFLCVFNDKETWDNEELLKQITIEPDKLYHEFYTLSMKEYTN